jgi:hypothetical protein
MKKATTAARIVCGLLALAFLAAIIVGFAR